MGADDVLDVPLDGGRAEAPVEVSEAREAPAGRVVLLRAPEPPIEEKVDDFLRGLNAEAWRMFRGFLLWVVAPVILFGVLHPVAAVAWLGFWVWRRLR